MVNSGKQVIPCETKISAYTGETPMPPWPLRLTPFPHTSGFLSLDICDTSNMPSTLEDMTQQVLQLPARQRLALAGFLLEMDDASDQSEVEEAWEKEIQE
jgi:hypothetical protein